MNQPLLWLAFVSTVGFGSYRTLRHGRGGLRWLGLLPVGLLLLGGGVAPFILGAREGAGAAPSVAGIGVGELMVIAVVGPVILAVIAGAILALVFRPARATARPTAGTPAADRP